MVQKAFSVFEKNGVVKLQIGQDVFGLDDTEKKNIFNCFSDAKQTRFLFSNKLFGTAIMYPNGLIAATISVGKLDLAGTKYLLMVYSLTPQSDKYDVNSFMVSGDALKSYMDTLAGTE